MKTLLGIPLKDMDVLKYIMQLRCVITWMNTGAKGTMEAATGFGKSIIACIAIYKMTKGSTNRTALVIVPTIQLKAQWEGVLEATGLSSYTTVLVVNTVALNTKIYNVDLLIIDEIHLMAADKFSRIFTNVKYNWILGLTATIDRLDGKEVYLKRYAPVVVSIPQKTAIERGWINDFLEINVPVFLTRAENSALQDISKQIRSYAAKFGDFDLMRQCMNSEKAVAYAQQYYPLQDPKEKGKEIARDAVQGQRCVRARQDFLYKTEHKVAATVDLINEFGLRTITFSQSTQFADEVKAGVGKRAVSYHSNLETVVRMVTKTKTYKTMSAARKFATSKGVNDVTGIVGKGYEVSWKEPKKMGALSLRKEALTRFLEPKYTSVDVMCTAKALDQGFDDPTVVLGVDASRSSNPTQHTQRTGRIARNYTYPDGTAKRGIYVNFYIPQSRDEDWLRKCQKNSSDVVEVADLDECITLIKKII